MNINAGERGDIKKYLSTEPIHCIFERTDVFFISSTNSEYLFLKNGKKAAGYAPKRLECNGYQRK